MLLIRFMFEIPVRSLGSLESADLCFFSSTLLHPLYLCAGASTPLPPPRPRRQQQLLRQTDVLSTPPLSSVPQGEAADVDVIV